MLGYVLEVVAGRLSTCHVAISFVVLGYVLEVVTASDCLHVVLLLMLLRSGMSATIMCT